MKFEKIHNKGQARLFQNQYLEMLTKTHPLVIWGMYVPVIIYMLYYSHDHFGFTPLRIALTFIGALLFWTLFPDGRFLDSGHLHGAGGPGRRAGAPAADAQRDHRPHGA